MNTNGERLFNRTATHWAKLASSVGINLRPLSPIVFRFVGEHKQKLTPPGITYAFAYVRAGQTLDIELLDKNNPILTDQLAAELVLKVKTLIAYLLMTLANLVSQFAVLTTSLLATGAPLLELGQSFLGGPEPARIFNQFATRQSGKVFEAHINPNASCWCRHWFDVGQFNLKDSKPITQIIPLDDDHLNTKHAVGQGTVLEHSDITHPLHIEPVAFQPNPVTIDVADRLGTTAKEHGLGRVWSRS
jgi:hypothetical protein